MTALYWFLGIVAYFAMIIAIAKVVGFNERKPRHPSAYGPVPKFPNYWRKGLK